MSIGETTVSDAMMTLVGGNMLTAEVGRHRRVLSKGGLVLVC